MIRIKRIYEPVDKEDGYRILVDRVWPRGVSKKEAAIDLWLKDIAPSTALRKWFAHEDRKWVAFKTKYLKELKGNTTVETLRDVIRANKVITLLYGAKNTLHNQAVVLKDFFD